jgi:hypothetical protein
LLFYRGVPAPFTACRNLVTPHRNERFLWGGSEHFIYSEAPEHPTKELYREPEIFRKNYGKKPGNMLK